MANTKLASAGCLAILSLLLLTSGCASSGKRLFTATGSDWHVLQGQAIWKPRKKMPEIGGDLVMAVDTNGRCLLEFSKTPMTLVRTQMTPEHWLIDFPPRDISFSGSHRPPMRFLWLQLWPALSGRTLPEPLSFQRKPDGGWRLENKSSGETLEGFLGP